MTTALRSNPVGATNSSTARLVWIARRLGWHGAPRRLRGDVKNLLVLQAVVATWSVFLFPGVAVLLRRRLVLLWSATGLALCLTLWFAAYAASVPKGTLPAEYDYSLPLPRSLLMYGLCLGLPQIAATVAVQALAGRIVSRFWLYVISLLSGIAAALLGGRAYTIAVS